MRYKRLYSKKKILFYSAQYKNLLENSSAYGWSIKNIKKTFQSLLTNKNQELKRLESIYDKNASKAGVKIFYERASLEKKNIIKLKDIKLIAKKIIIATGGAPKKLPIIGNDYCINSDQIMELKKIPNKLTIIGSGYIAVEFAFIFSFRF